MMTTEWIAIGTLFLTLFAQALYLGSQFGMLRVKVDTIWEFFMRRGMVEAQLKGFLAQQSPVSITEQTRLAYAPILAELKRLRTQYPKASQQELTLIIERHLGEWIVSNICLPFKITEGACLVTAYHLCLSEDPPTVPDDLPLTA